MSAEILKDPRFVSFVRKRGVAGKEVTAEEFQGLVDEFQGAQTVDTQKATQIFAGMPDPTPNAAAAGESFAPTSMDYNDLGILTGASRRDPIMSTVEEVAAQEQDQAAQQKVAEQDDPMLVFTRERVMPAIDQWRQKRSAISTGQFKNTYERKMANDSLDGLVARNITDLEGVGYWGPEQSAMYSTFIEKEKAPPEEAFARTVNAKLNPDEQRGVAVSSADANEMFKTATQKYDTAVRYAEMNPEDPKARAAVESARKVVEATQKQAGLSTELDMFTDYQSILRNATILRNAQKDNIPSIIIDGETLTEDTYDAALSGIQAKLGTYEATPEFVEGRPQLKKNDFNTKEEWQAAVREAGGIYRDEEGRLITPQRFADQAKKDSFKRFRTNDAPATVDPPEENAPSLTRAEENMIRRMIEKGEDITNTKFAPTPEVVECPPQTLCWELLGKHGRLSQSEH